MSPYATDQHWPALATVQAEDAHRVAITDRQSHADLVLQVAVDEALEHIRAGRVGFAEYRLERAYRSAQRILGKTAEALS